MNDINRLYSLLVKLEEQDIEFKDAYRAAVIDTLSICVKEQYERSKVEELLNCLRHNHGKIIANTEDLTTLYQAYVYVGNDNYAFLTKIAISSGAGGLDFAEDDDRIEACSFTSVVTDTLAGDEVHEIDSLSAVFGKYIRTTEQDALCLSELRDYYNTPEKWSEDSDINGEVINFDYEIEYIKDWINIHMSYLDREVFPTSSAIIQRPVDIIHDGYFYNLHGHKIKKEYIINKGIYIFGGKKYTFNSTPASVR
jgi:hypothetical protein